MRAMDRATPLRARLNPRVVVAAVYVAAMFINIMDITIVNVALPTLAQEFGVGTGSIEWVVIGYLLSLAVWIPASGWIGDRIGTKRTFLFALAMFTGASTLCGLATSLGQLIAFRILQGVGGGMLAPVGLAMLFRAFPPERRAAASKVLIIPTAIAPASGPILGGLLIDTLSWRWVFFVNIPIGIAAFAFGLVFLTEHREPAAGRFDVPGFVLSAMALALVLLGLSQGPYEGWTSPVVVVSLAVGTAAAVALVVVELRVTAPMLALRLFANRLFRATNAASLFSSATFLGTLFVLPLFLQEVRGLSALESGLTTFPEALGVIAMAQLAGRIYPYVGPRRLMMTGLGVMVVVLVAMTTVGLDTSLWLVRTLVFVLGAGYALMIVPLQAASFATIAPADTGRASALYNAQRQVGAALGVAILATALGALLPAGGGSSDEQVRAYHGVFLVGAALAAVGIAVAGRVHDADAAGTMRRRAAAADAAAPPPDTEAAAIAG